MEPAPPAGNLPLAGDAVTPLFEGLGHPGDLLADGEVLFELGGALLAASQQYDLGLQAGARYGGVYCLLAHPDAHVRAMVRSQGGPRRAPQGSVLGAAHPRQRAWGGRA